MVMIHFYLLKYIYLINNQNIKIEDFSKRKHSVEEITDLLHRSYAKLLNMGLNFWATTPAAEYILKRFNDGHGIVAVLDGKIVETITVV